MDVLTLGKRGGVHLTQTYIYIVYGKFSPTCPSMAAGGGQLWERVYWLINHLRCDIKCHAIYASRRYWPTIDWLLSLEIRPYYTSICLTSGVLKIPRRKLVTQLFFPVLYFGICSQLSMLLYQMHKNANAASVKIYILVARQCMPAAFIHN